MPKRKRRRRRRGVEEVRALLREARERGLSEHELAADAGVHPNTVARWARRECSEGDSHLEPAPHETAFVPVHVTVATPPGTDQDDRITVKLEGAFACRDVHVALPRGVDPGDLRELLGALAQHAC